MLPAGGNGTIHLTGRAGNVSLVSAAMQTVSATAV